MIALFWLLVTTHFLWSSTPRKGPSEWFPLRVHGLRVLMRLLVKGMGSRGQGVH